jgi:uncharacterized protein
VATTRTHPRPATKADGWPVMVTVILVLAVYNVVGNLWIPQWAYVPTNLTVAALLVLLASRAGLGLRDLGLEPGRLPVGIRYGAVAVAAVILLLVAAALVPATRGFFEDDRVRVGTAEMARQTLLMIPFGTVVLEEIAFRSVLLGLFARHWGTVKAVLASSALFGLWHIVPSIPAAGGNDVVNSTAASASGMAAVVAGAVVATAVAGLFFCWLRLRSGSVVAPMVLHIGTNSGSFVIAWLVVGANG